jgi:hypothetical protein
MFRLIVELRDCTAINRSFGKPTMSQDPSRGPTADPDKIVAEQKPDHDVQRTRHDADGHTEKRWVASESEFYCAENSDLTSPIRRSKTAWRL